MKRILSLALACLLVLSLVGGALVSAVAEQQIVLRAVDWSDSSIKHREAFNKKFEEMHPGVKIEYTMLTIDQFKNTIVTMIKSGDGPDVFPIPVGMTLATALKEEWYQPLDGLVTDEFIATIDPAVLMEGVSHKDGKFYNIPEAVPVTDTNFYYNKDVLDAAGVTQLPETYEEFRAVLKQVTDAGNGSFYGLIDGGKQLGRLNVMARSFASMAGAKMAPGSNVITSNGRATFDAPEMVGFFKLMEDIYLDGTLHPDTVNINAPEAREYFAQGQAAFLMQGMWCIPTWANTYPNLNYGVMSVPKPSMDTVGAISQGAVAPWLGIYKQSKHPELAAEYIMALFSEEYGYQSGCVSDGNYVSIIPAINEKYMTHPVMKAYYDTAKAAAAEVPWPTKRDAKAYDFYAEVKDVQPSLAALLQGVISGGLTDYEDALRKLAEDSTVEWRRASEAIGLDFAVFDFPNWTVGTPYLEADYDALLK